MCELSPSLSPTIISQHNLDRDDYWVSKASATAYYRHMRGDQEQDVWVMMTDQDVIILSHGAVIYNLAMWTLSHVSSWDVGADVSSIGYIIIIW